MTGRIKAVSFVAKSGTGKTTLPDKTIAKMKRRGHRVGALKNAPHGFDIDHAVADFLEAKFLHG